MLRQQLVRRVSGEVVCPNGVSSMHDAVCGTLQGITAAWSSLGYEKEENAGKSFWCDLRSLFFASARVFYL